MKERQNIREKQEIKSANAASSMHTHSGGGSSCGWLANDNVVAALMHGDAQEILALARAGGTEPITGPEERAMRRAYDGLAGGVPELPGSVVVVVQRDAQVRTLVEECCQIVVLRVVNAYGRNDQVRT